MLLLTSLYFNNILPVGIGLQNLGNTCYMNAALQCLYHVKPISDFLINNLKTGYYSPNSAATDYAELVYQYRNHNDPSNPFIAPCPISWKHFGGLFQEWKQEDAAEFLNFLIASIADGDIEPAKIISRFLLPYMAIRNKSMIKNPINSTLFFVEESVRTCSVCGNVTSIPEFAAVVTLPIEKPKIIKVKGKRVKQPVTLAQCLDQYIRPELLTKGNEVYCDVCKKKTLPYKQIKFKSTPNILRIDLKRFASNLSKINTNVICPLNSLNLNKYLSNNSFAGFNQEYNLKSFVLQQGSFSGGHYTAYVKDDNTWYHYDDSSVTPVNINTLKQALSQAYILFYEKSPMILDKESGGTDIIDSGKLFQELSGYDLNNYLKTQGLTVKNLVDAINNGFITVEFLKKDMKLVVAIPTPGAPIVSTDADINSLINLDNSLRALSAKL